MSKSTAAARFTASLVILATALVAEPSEASRRKKQEAEDARLSAAELQSRVMSFADRYSAAIDGSLTDMRVAGIDSELEPEIRMALSSSMVFSALAAFDIAAGPNPDVAMLDLVVLTMLNRLYLEHYWQPRVGEAVDSLLTSHVDLEQDIWGIAAEVLTPEEQQELRAMIEQFYQARPELYMVNYVRFNDFAGQRRQSSLVKSVKSGGLLKPLKETERELEQTRLLAERAMYLGSRYAAMPGSMIDVWLSSWATHPDVGRLLADLHLFSASTDRLVTEVEQLPDAVAMERQAAVEQILTGISEERQRTLQEIFARQEEFHVALADLQTTIQMVDDLLTTGDALAQRLGFEPGEREEVESGVVTFQKAMVEVSKSAQDLAVVVDGLNELVNSPNWQSFMPRLHESVDRVELAGEKLVSRAVILGIGFLSAWLVFYIVGKLAVHLLITRVLGDRPAAS